MQKNTRKITGKVVDSMGYTSNFVQNSPIITYLAGEDFVGGRGKAVTFGEEGAVILATSVENAFGVLAVSTEDIVSTGERVEVHWKDIVLLAVSEAVSQGDLITLGEDGCGKKAVSGDKVFGRCFSLGEAGSLVRVSVSPYGGTV